jgi:ubiquinone/menaquinone biosynthesis C-methylase UbiE
VKLLDDISRLRQEYTDRDRRLAGSDVYSWLNMANLFAIHQRQRVVLAAFKHYGFMDLANIRVLEIGCGAGGVLKEFLSFGTTPCNLYGVDLLSDRLALARSSLPGSAFLNADGQSLPFAGNAFDIVIQFTAISSILDDRIRRNICKDMLRAIKKDGLLLSYDFWLNPTNRQTRGIRPAEIRRLFPGCSYEFQRITLAPPIARRLATVSWGLCLFLESLKVFNTHYLAVIQQK